MSGIVESLVFKGVHYEMIVNANNFNWKIQSTQMSEVGSRVGLFIGPNEIHVMKRNL